MTVAIEPYWSTGTPGWIIVSLLQIGLGELPLHSIRPTSLAPPPLVSQVPAGGVIRPSRTSQPGGTPPDGLIEQKMLPVGLVNAAVTAASTFPTEKCCIAWA